MACDDAMSLKWMGRALRMRDLESFAQILNTRPDLWSKDEEYFRMSKRSLQKVTLLFKLAASEFYEGLEYFIEHYKESIRTWDARFALHWIVKNRKSKTVSHMLLELALARLSERQGSIPLRDEVCQLRNS